MSNVKFSFLLFVAMYCCVDHLMACTCRPCKHYSNYYERCRCCTFHMVGGKRSGTLGTFNNNPLAAQPPKSLPRNAIRVNGKTQRPIHGAVHVSDLESSISLNDHESMKNLMLSFLTGSNPLLPESHDLNKASNSQDFVGVPPSVYKIGKRLVISPPLSIFDRNTVNELDRSSAINQDVMNSLLRPGQSQIESPRPENGDLVPLNKLFYKKIFNALQDNKNGNSASVLSSSEVENTEKRTLTDLLSSPDP